MTNLERAVELYKGGNYTCVLCRDDETLTSMLTGIAPMVGFIESGVDLRGFSAADKIVGRAAAMLFVHAGVSEVYAEVMSVAAADFLKKHGVKFSYACLVNSIINRNGTGMCPMELAVSDISDTGEAFVKIQHTIEKLKNGGGTD